ncbi:hypothetical protein A6F68_00460 [Tsuneonella dongtanensis]|uniref:Lipoprotein n=1 Tax=Tsuneonella dongtanensis TaxID=692370 RepID=A0A1B2AAC1_9SPHN|nr:hypothetical protein [Tsuneonella dongtanensis]ANY18995.1 hypothetical protein A6F68_00460 [Tsuneonella dongtanensis]
MRGPTLVLLPIAAFGLSGCLAKTAFDVATAPVRVASKAVDLATTSQSEADEKRGREIRKREERLGQLERERDKLQKKCLEGVRRACDDAAAVNAEMRALMPQVPYEPEEPR